MQTQHPVDIMFGAVTSDDDDVIPFIVDHFLGIIQSSYGTALR